MSYTVNNTYRNLFGGNINIETLVYYVFIGKLILFEDFCYFY